MERRASAARSRRAHSQLPAHAVGQENSGMVAHAARGAARFDPAQQQIRFGRPRSKLLQRNFLVPRPLRPALGTRAADLWKSSLYELTKYRPKSQREKLHQEILPADRLKFRTRQPTDLVFLADSSNHPKH